MISQDDIEAMQDDEALSRAAERLEQGTVTLREAPAQDFRGIIRAGVMWRNIAMRLWEDQQARQRDAMSVGERD